MAYFPLKVSEGFLCSKPSAKKQPLAFQASLWDSPKNKPWKPLIFTPGDRNSAGWTFMAAWGLVYPIVWKTRDHHCVIMGNRGRRMRASASQHVDSYDGASHAPFLLLSNIIHFKKLSSTRRSLLKTEPIWCSFSC